MSHTWQSRSSKARKRTQHKKRQISRRRQLSTNQRANFSAELATIQTITEKASGGGS
jgi:hypothetical protein